MQTFRAATLLKRDSKTGVFLWYCELFMNSYFEEHLRTTASVLNGFFRATSFWEDIFWSSLSNISISNFYFTFFVSIDTFISLKNCIITGTVTRSKNLVQMFTMWQGKLRWSRRLPAPFLNITVLFLNITTHFLNITVYFLDNIAHFSNTTAHFLI